MATIRGTCGNDSISGTPDDDVMFGLVGNDTLNGTDGNDILLGEAGDDSLDGGAGIDTSVGGSGNDTLTGTNGDRLYGDSGNDTLVVGGDDGQPVLTANGNDGNDTFISAKADNLPAELDLNFGLNLTGGDGDDAFTFPFGVLQASAIDGGSGNDHFTIRYMLGGVLAGGDGQDRFEIRNMAGVISAGDDNDVISVGTSKAGDTILMGDDGEDLISAVAGSSIIDGGAGNDHLSDGLDLFDLASQLDGGTGDDELSSPGRDLLLGGDGRDTLESGAFANTLTGGAGPDHFVYGPLVNLGSIRADTITDFNQAEGDVLDVSRLLERVGAPNDPFASGFLDLSVQDGSTLVLFDADGGGDDFRAIATLENTILAENDIVTESAPPPPSLGRYYLADADTDQPLIELSNRSVIDPAVLAGHNLTILAVLNKSNPDALFTESVRLNFDSGAATRVEHVEPYALFGDVDGDLRGGLALNEGLHQIAFDFYDTPDAQGGLLGSESLTLLVTFSAAGTELLLI